MCSASSPARPARPPANRPESEDLRTTQTPLPAPLHELATRFRFLADEALAALEAEPSQEHPLTTVAAALQRGIALAEATLLVVTDNRPVAPAGLRRLPPGPAADSVAAVLRKDGPLWTASFAGVTVRLRHARGLDYLRHLLSYPGSRIHSVALALERDGRATGAPHDEDTFLSSVEEAGQRLKWLQEELEVALGDGDRGRARGVQTLVDGACAELFEALGHGQRRSAAHRVVERARIKVSRAIALAIRRIGSYHPELAAHLRATIRTGAFCIYLPDPRLPIRWTT